MVFGHSIQYQHLPPIKGSGYKLVYYSLCKRTRNLLKQKKLLSKTNGDKNNIQWGLDIILWGDLQNLLYPKGTPCHPSITGVRMLEKPILHFYRVLNWFRFLIVFDF